MTESSGWVDAPIGTRAVDEVGEATEYGGDDALGWAGDLGLSRGAILDAGLRAALQRKGDPSLADSGALGLLE